MAPLYIDRCWMLLGTLLRSVSPGHHLKYFTVYDSTSEAHVAVINQIFIRFCNFHTRKDLLSYWNYSKGTVKIDKWIKYEIFINFSLMHLPANELIILCKIMKYFINLEYPGWVKFAEEIIAEIEFPFCFYFTILDNDSGRRWKLLKVRIFH